MSWDPTDDDPTARRPYYPESSGLCNCDDCRTQPTEENER